MVFREGTNPEGAVTGEEKDTPWDALKTAKEERASAPEDDTEREPESSEVSEGAAKEELFAPLTEEDEMDPDAVEDFEEIAPPPMEELPSGVEPTDEELDKERESGTLIGGNKLVVKGELKRLRKAVEAYEAHVFKGTPLSVADMATIARIGGEQVIKKQLELTLAQRYSEGAVVRKYYKNNGRIDQREMWALRYWAKQAGKDIATYAKERMVYYNNKEVRAIDIVVSQLRADGRFDPDYLTLDECDLVLNYPDVEYKACGRVYRERRELTISYLAGHDKGEVKLGTPDVRRDIDIATRFLTMKTRRSPAELGAYYRGIAMEVYHPTGDMRTDTETFTQGLVAKIPEQDINKTIDVLYANGGYGAAGIRAMVSAQEKMFKKFFNLNGDSITVVIDMSDEDKDGTLGFFDEEKKILQVNARYAEKYIRSDNPGASYSNIQVMTLRKISEIVAHEFLHAHQHDYGQKNDDRRGIAYVINCHDYIPPEIDYYTYKRQRIERESFSFGEKFGAKFASVYYRRRGGRI